MSADSSAVVDQIIRDRRTTKVLAPEPLDVPAERDWTELFEDAAWAPFHRPADASHRQGALDGIMPWRFHVLNAKLCRELREALADREAGKIRDMLASADLLVLATWLPNPAEVSSPNLYAGSLENMEHIAAASCAIQNVLLAATARNIPNYWSSGGVLRSVDVAERLGISPAEILLGAIFLFPEQTGEGVQVVHSKLRDQRTPLPSWVHTIEEIAAVS